MSLRLDNCEHCACVTPLVGYTPASAIAALERGELGCWNCSECLPSGNAEARHSRCVQLHRRRYRAMGWAMPEGEQTVKGKEGSMSKGKPVVAWVVVYRDGSLDVFQERQQAENHVRFGRSCGFVARIVKLVEPRGRRGKG
jgi:hypothetical protein